MPWKKSTYKQVREKMQPGDVIAFGGKGHFSEIIKFATRASVSHVGVVLQTRVKDEKKGRYFNQIIESTSLQGFNGVSISRLSQRVSQYKGEIWWLPISSKIRKSKFDETKFFDFLFAQEGRKYDTEQAVKSALDLLDQLPFDLRGPTYNREDFSRFFCSELVAAGLEAAGMVGAINSAEVTPIDLCRWNVYENDYYQLIETAKKKITEEKEISRYNTLDPTGWSS